MSKISDEKVIIAEIYHAWLMAYGHNALDHALEMWSKGPAHSIAKAKNAGWSSEIPILEWSEHWEIVGQHIIEEMDVWICDASDLSKIRRPEARELLDYKALLEKGELGPQGQADGSKFDCDENEVVFRA